MIFPPVEKNLILGFSDKEKPFSALLKELSLNENEIIAMLQEHKDRVAWVGKKDLGTKIDHTDALIAADTGIFLAVRVADCVAVLFFDPKTKVVAAAHCGWRGVKVGVAAKVVEEMKCEGIDPTTLKVFLTPSARSCCYEVGDEVANEFGEQFGREVVEEREGKRFLNLQKCLNIQLTRVGVKEENIFDPEICTIHNSDRYHSFRADQDKGHNVAIIGWRS